MGRAGGGGGGEHARGFLDLVLDSPDCLRFFPLVALLAAFFAALLETMFVSAIPLGAHSELALATQCGEWCALEVRGWV